MLYCLVLAILGGGLRGFLWYQSNFWVVFVYIISIINIISTSWLFQWTDAAKKHRVFVVSCRSLSLARCWKFRRSVLTRRQFNVYISYTPPSNFFFSPTFRRALPLLYCRISLSNFLYNTWPEKTRCCYAGEEAPTLSSLKHCEATLPNLLLTNDVIVHCRSARPLLSRPLLLWRHSNRFCYMSKDENPKPIGNPIVVWPASSNGGGMTVEFMQISPTYVRWIRR